MGGSGPRDEPIPGGRIDYDITRNLRLNVSDTWARTVNGRGFRGTVLPGPFTQEQWFGQVANVYIATAGVTWTLRPNMVNDASFGIQSNQETFAVGFDIGLFQPRLMDFPLGLPSGLEERNGLGFGNTLQPRNNPTYNLVDNFHFQHGAHALTFGGNMIRSSMHQATLGDAGIPRFAYGIVPSDPVNAVFNSATLPGIAADARNDALALYALLAGRVSSVSKTRNVGEKTLQYADFQRVVLRERETSFGFYFQDSWRVNRSLTLNYGLRWDFQGDNENTNNIYTSPNLRDLFGPSGAALGNNDNSPNLFRPGSLLGAANPSIFQRSKAYNADYVNPAPHAGIAWNPSFQNGLLGSLLGARKTVFRAAYSINYYSEGLLNFTNLAGSNPGLRQSGTLVPEVDFPAGSLSVAGALPAFRFFPASFSFPLPLSNFTFTNTTVSTIDPNLRAPYIQSWSASIQRELRAGTVLEVRYVGNHGVHLWHSSNINEVNIFENGFLNDFQAAQKNLAINAASGQAGFANTGLPLQGFGNTNFINLLQTGQAGTLANSIASNSTYFCRMVGSSFEPCARLGFTGPGQYPVNFFKLNPFLTTANLLSDNSFSNYNGFQVELRQRFSQGLTLNVNYSWADALTDRYNKNVDNSSNFTTLRDRRLDRRPSPWDIHHVVQAFGTYQLPFGKGRLFSIKNPVIDAVAGGWTLGSIFRLQTGLPFKLSSGRGTVNQRDSGVIPVGITASDLQDMVGVFKPAGRPDVFFLDPKLVGSDGRASASFLAVPTAPCQFGGFIYLYGPKLVSADVFIAKQMPIIGDKLRMEIRAEMVNAFNHPIFQVPTGGTFNVTPVSIAATSFGRTTTTRTVPRQIQFRIRFAF